MKIALGWIDLADSTDRTLVEGLGPELQKLGHCLVIVGPRRRSGLPFLEFRAPNKTRLSTPSPFPLPLPGGEVLLDVLRNEIPIYRVGFYFLQWFSWLNDVLATIQLLWIHKKESIDLWHCHVGGRDHRAMRWATRVGRWKLLVTIQFALRNYLSFVGHLKGLEGLAKQAYHVTCLSQSLLTEVLELSPELKDRSSVVNNGGHLTNGHANDAYMQELQRRIPKPYILSVARLARYKGVDLLTMAFAKLLDQGHNIHLVICGYDHMHGGLNKFIQDLGLENHVYLTGQIPHSQVTQLLQECLFMVLPSREEPFGIAVVEAMACGKAVVATKAGGIPEIVRDGIDGILVPPNNVDALTKGLKQLLENNVLRERLGQSAKERSQEFSWNRVAREYARLYQKGNG